MIIIVLFIPYGNVQSITSIDTIGQDLYKEYIFYSKIYYLIKNFKYEDIYNHKFINAYEDNLPVVANVELKTTSGKSMTKSNISEQITSKNVKDFKPSEENMNLAVKTLKKLGFDVKALAGAPTFTIQGDKTLFEKVFKTELKKNDDGIITLVNPVFPNELSDLVETISFERSLDFPTKERP